MHVQIKAERPDCYNAGGYVFPPPQARPQLPVSSFPSQQQPYMANHPISSQTPAVTNSQPDIANIETSKVSEDQVDFSSIKGIFGWTLIDDIHVPCIFRHEKKYVSVRIVEHKLLSKYPNSYPDELGKHAPLTSFFITVNEAKLLNEINTVHCDGEFGQKQFTTKDLIVLLTDFEVFYGLVKKTFPENKVQNVNETQSTQPKVENNEAISLKILSKYCGWFQINNTVSPYIRRADDKYIPLSVIRYAAGLLVDIPVTGVLLSVAECELLNKTCKAAGFDFCFSKTTRVIALSEVTRHCSVHIRDLPFASPLTHAQYMDLPSPGAEQRPTPPPGQCRPTPPPGHNRPTPSPGYPSQGNMGIPLQNIPPQINGTMMQMQSKQNDGYQQRPNNMATMPMNPTMYNQRMFMYNRPPWMHNSTVSPPNVSLNPQSNMPIHGQFQSQNMSSLMNRPHIPISNPKNPLPRNNTTVNNVSNGNQNGWHGQHPYQNPMSRLDTYMMNHPINRPQHTNPEPVNKHSQNMNSNLQNHGSVADSQPRQHSSAPTRAPVMSTSQHAMLASQALSAAAEQHITASHPRRPSSEVRYQSGPPTSSSAIQNQLNIPLQVSSNIPSSVANVTNSNSSVIQKMTNSVPQMNPTLTRKLTNEPIVSENNDTSDQQLLSPVGETVKQNSSDLGEDATVVSESVPVNSDSSVGKISDSDTNKLQNGVMVQQLKEAISGVWLGGKSISCLCLDLPNRSGKFCLVEAVCKLYFSGCSVEEFQFALASVLNIPLVTCTDDEEKAFILYYSLPVKELKCNKMIGFEELQSFFPQLNYMFKDKKSTDAQDKNMSDTDQVGSNELYVQLEKPEEEKRTSPKPGSKRPCTESAGNSPPAKQPNRTLEETVQKLKNQQVPNTGMYQNNCSFDIYYLLFLLFL